jgi:hypothetical protein
MKRYVSVLLLGSILVVAVLAGAEPPAPQAAAPAGFDARRDNIERGKLKTVDERKIPHIWHIDSGGHTWSVWKNDLYLLIPMLFREK